jgi:hypothetical protein
MEEITLELGKLKMDIMLEWLTERKRKGTGSEIVEGYVHLYSGVSKDRRREVLRNENVLYLVALNAVAHFLFISAMFVYLNVVLSFYCSVGKLKWCDVKDPTVVKLRLIVELWVGEFIPPCVHFIRSFHFRLIFTVIMEHFTSVNVKKSEKMLACGTTPCHVEQYSTVLLDWTRNAIIKKKIVVHCNLFWTEPRLNGNPSLAQNV